MSATPPLFLQKDWFELLLNKGLPAGRLATRVEAGSLAMFLLAHGRTLESCSNFYSPVFGFEGGAQPDEASLQAFASALRDNRPQQVMLRPLPADAAWLNGLRQALSRDFFTDQLPVSTNWYLPCAGLSWVDYLAQRPSRLRNTLRRCQNKLKSMPGFRIDLVTQTGEAFEAALAAFQRVYAASWKEPEPFPDFIPGLCRMAAAQGTLRLAVLQVGDEPAAAQLWFVKNQTASIYKLAYDARFARLGVGTVLTAALFEHVMSIDRVAEVDFLTGDDAYKAEWMTHHRELVALLAFDRHSLGGRLRAARHFAPRWLKSRIRKHP